MKWTKENCPFCGSDGKVWKWNNHGGQSYVKCDHEYDEEALFAESKQIVKDIGKLNMRKQEIKEMLACSIKENK